MFNPMTQKRPFLGGKGRWIVFFVVLEVIITFQLQKNQLLPYIYFNFSRGVVQEHTKKVQLIKFGRLPVRQYSLNIKNIRIWATFT